MTSARILIVEDDRVVARDIAQQMVHSGHTVVGSTASGGEAIELAANTHPDLVLMDVRLEGELDGVDAARRLREIHNIPTVFLTAYADEETVRRATVTEPFGYVLKPFDDQQLRTVVEIALYKHAAERRLRESEQRYAVTLSSIGDGVIATDWDSRITFINPVAEALTQWTRDAAAGRPLASVLQLISEDTGEPFEDAASAVCVSGAPSGVPARIVLVGRDGRKVPVENKSSPIVDDHGQNVGVVIVIRDISERRRAEEAEILRESNERLGIAMGGSNVGVWEFDPASADERRDSLRVWNVWEWLGYSDSKTSSSFESFIEITHPDDRIRVKDAFERRFGDTQGAFEIEHRLLHRDGSYRWVLARGTTRRNAIGTPVCLTGTLVDITELKMAEQALRASEERFRGTFENAAVGIAHCDSDGRFLRVNQRYCDIAGYSKEQLLQLTFCDITDPDYVATSFSHFQMLKEGTISHYTEEKQIVRRDGSRVWISVCVSFQRDHDDQISHSIAILQDISERKALEETVRIAKDDAEAANKAKDQFLANISHELRTPLNGILGYAQVLHRDQTLDVQQKSNVTIIEQSGEHLLTLINDLLDFVRMGKDSIQLHPEDILLAPFLDTIVEIVGVRAREKGLAQNFTIDPGLPTAISVDVKRLRQVLLNLLSNAVKFTDEGEVRFAVSKIDPDRLRFEVQDTGVGIRQDQLDRIFRPFEQTGDPRRQSAGAGLGLAISQQLVRLMGSEIYVESHDGRGSRFWFDLAAPFALTGSSASKGELGTRESGTTTLEATATFHVPAREGMETLHRLALRGSMRDVIRHADSMLAIDTRYHPFVSRVRRLAENYESQALLAFIEEHLKGD